MEPRWQHRPPYRTRAFGTLPSTEGTATGDLTAHFDSIGPQAVPPSDEASMQGG